jgi:hypothetical protein
MSKIILTVVCAVLQIMQVFVAYLGCVHVALTFLLVRKLALHLVHPWDSF